MDRQSLGLKYTQRLGESFEAFVFKKIELPEAKPRRFDYILFPEASYKNQRQLKA